LFKIVFSKASTLSFKEIASKAYTPINCADFLEILIRAIEQNDSPTSINNESEPWSADKLPISKTVFNFIFYKVAKYVFQ
jgi:hypothetical protein